MGNEFDLSNVVFQLALDAESRSAEQTIEVSDVERPRFCTLWKLRILGYLEDLSWRDNKGFDLSWLGEQNEFGEAIVDKAAFERFVQGTDCLLPETLDALVAQFRFKSREEFMDAALAFLPSNHEAQKTVYDRIVQRLDENLSPAHKN